MLENSGEERWLQGAGFKVHVAGYIIVNA
jgi:hypothetical protein